MKTSMLKTTRLRRLVPAIALAAALLTGTCTIGPTHGVLFTINTFAGEFNPANDVKSAKRAEGCQHYVLWLVSFGHAGAGRIARDNKIERIAVIDHSTRGVLFGLYSNYCTIVYGE